MKLVMSRQMRIEQALQAFSPTELIVINESGRHQGHAGDNGTGETHYAVRIVVAQFKGLSRVAQHRLVMAALADEFKSGLHAITIESRF